MFPLNPTSRVSEGTHSVHFNQQSTKEFLRQLKLSVGNISAMIVKQKKSLGIDTSTLANTNRYESPTTNLNAISAIDANLHDESSFNLYMSIDMDPKSTTQLAYSTNPNLVYRSGHKYFKMIDSRGIGGKLTFDDENEEEKSDGKWRKQEKRVTNSDGSGMGSLRTGAKWQNLKDEESGNKYGKPVREESTQNYCSQSYKPKWSVQTVSTNVNPVNQRYFKHQLRNVEESPKEKMHSTNITSENQYENTCCQNELQNILVLKSKAKKGTRNVQKSLQLFLNSLEDQQSPHRKPIVSSVKSPKPNNLHKQQSKSPSAKPKSPFKSPKPQKLKTFLNSPTPVEKKSNFVDRKSFISGKVSPNKTTAYKERSSEKQKSQRQKSKYSHISKSPKNKNSEVLQIKSHLKTPKQQWNRKKFVEDMCKKGYIRSFLTVDQLNILYSQLESKEVPRFQWEEKINERIFKKIHHMEGLI